MLMKITTVALTALTGIAMSSEVAAQSASAQPIIYPSKGQTTEQLEKDKSECYAWATQRSGFDPATALAEQQALVAKAHEQAQSAQQQVHRQSGAARGSGAAGAVKGAAAGALIGAVAGDTGKGAAIGATAGAIAGHRNRKRAEAHAAQQYQQAQQQIAAQQAQQHAAVQQKLTDYNRSFHACMEGRGYTVK